MTNLESIRPYSADKVRLIFQAKRGIINGSGANAEFLPKAGSNVIVYANILNATSGSTLILR